MLDQFVVSRLKKKYPDQEIRLIGSGWSSVAYEIGDKIIRVPKAGAEQYRKEACILSFLQGKLAVKIPNPRLIEKPFFYAEHKKINGLNWTIETYNHLPLKQQNAFAKDSAHFFAQLHTIPKSEILKYIPEEQLRPYA